MRSSFLALVAASAALAGMSVVHAQDIQIAGLICTGDPEIVVINNNGSAPQNMAGWTLRSDPEDSQVFDLSVVGTIPAGDGITVLSGAEVSPVPTPPVYMWTTQERYRDFDPTDYARVVSNEGGETDRENCPAVEPTPSVGGIAELPDVSGPSGLGHVPLAGLVAVALALLGAGAWYARWRFRQG